MMSPLQLPVLDNVSLEEILTKINERKPILIKNWDIGPCVEKWSFEYVSNKAGSEPVKIHVSNDGKMDFLNKNFLYKTLPFNELINRISQSHQKVFFIKADELYYLRSLGNDPRGKDVANFLEQSELSRDLKIPPFYNEKDFFSSVFRASSRGLQLWTHYDVMNNILIQVRGLKKIVLWPPSEVDNMYMNGDKSEVLDIDNPDVLKYPKFLKAVRYECIMNPGDIVFIPALWFHNTLAIEPSIGVNIFWKNLPHDLYDKNDSYGNKDLLPGAKAIQAVQTATKSLNVLPEEYKMFYIRRMIKLLEKNIEQRGEKILLSVWWDQKEILYYWLLKPDEIAKRDRYQQQLINLNHAVLEKRPDWDRRYECSMIMLRTIVLPSSRAQSKRLNGFFWPTFLLLTPAGKFSLHTT